MPSDFRARMRARAEQVGELAVDLVAKVGVEAGTSFVLETPVDTAEARSDWVASTGAPRSDTVPITTASATISAIEAVAATVNPDGSLYIVNNAGHIVPLNDGWSQQAPAGYFEAAIQRATRKVAGLRAF